MEKILKKEKPNTVFYNCKRLLYQSLIMHYGMPIAFLLAFTTLIVTEIFYQVITDEDIQPINLEYEYIAPESAAEDISSLTGYEEISDPWELYNFDIRGFIDVNTQLNVRSEPNTDSDIITTLYWMDPVQYSKVNEDWAIIWLDSGEAGYIARKYIVDEEVTYSKTYEVSGDKAKTYMDYRTITSRSSKQYRLQLRATTDQETGLRILRDRYMVALGSYFNCKVGQFVDIVLSDGEILKCIVGDAKQDIHTDANNLHGLSGDTAEFIVDEKVLKANTSVNGNISYVSDTFDGKVVEVRVYDHIER